jgi:phage tail sheath protein FI
MLNPTTPGVSVEEITKLPYSVALVETAIPAFIGYTELMPSGENKPLKINSLLEYEHHFGKAKKENLQLKDVEGKGVTVVAPQVQFLMYYSLQMYFANGGGPCYIVSVGTYPLTGGVLLSSLNDGLNMIETIKKPILILVPDAISLPSEDDFYIIYNKVIGKAKDETKNRFALLDTYYGNSTALSNGFNTITNFRKEVNPTSHSAAYFPYLKTILNYTFDDKAIIDHKGLQDGQISNGGAFYMNEKEALQELRRLASDEILFASANVFVLADLLAQAVAIVEEINETADQKVDLIEPIATIEAIENGTIDSVDINFLNEFNDLIEGVSAAKDIFGNAHGITLENLQTSDSLLYNQIKEAIQSLKVILPPSSTMAGVYGRIDSTKGVWKAPANVSLNYVMSPTEKVSDQEQSDLNIHVSGKSINAIRTFTGKGTLVWGARTLEGNDKKEDGKDNEWKYVQVRRYYNMVKQSISEALDKKFISEPNIFSTWIRAKATIENFLHEQWMDGALAGSTPKEAYEVKVDGVKGSHTMDVEIKIALVRPAEFILLTFSHKLQQF